MFDLRPRLVHSFKNRQTFFNANVDLPCPVCGQDVTFASRVSGVLCGHCGSPLHRQPDDATAVGPTTMLPFRLSEQDAQTKLAGATEPAASAAGQPPRLRKVYVPYWQLAAHITSSWRVAKEGNLDAVDDPDGHVAVDYDELFPAVPSDSTCLTGLARKRGTEAGAYESSQLAGIEVRTPTVALVDAWSAAGEKWEPRLRKQIGDEYGALRKDEAIDLIVTEYSNERGAMVLVPVYLPEPTTDGAPVPFAVDGYSGDVLRPPETRRADATDSPDPLDELLERPMSDAFVGRAVLVVIAGGLLLFGLWFAQRLWFY